MYRCPTGFFFVCPSATKETQQRGWERRRGVRRVSGSQPRRSVRRVTCARDSGDDGISFQIRPAGGGHHTNSFLGHSGFLVGFPPTNKIFDLGTFAANLDNGAFLSLSFRFVLSRFVMFYNPPPMASCYPPGMMPQGRLGSCHGVLTPKTNVHLLPSKAFWKVVRDPFPTEIVSYQLPDYGICTHRPRSPPGDV